MSPPQSRCWFCCLNLLLQVWRVWKHHFTGPVQMCQFHTGPYVCNLSCKPSISMVPTGLCKDFSVKLVLHKQCWYKVSFPVSVLVCDTDSRYGSRLQWAAWKTPTDPQIQVSAKNTFHRSSTAGRSMLISIAGLQQSWHVFTNYRKTHTQPDAFTQ